MRDYMLSAAIGEAMLERDLYSKGAELPMAIENAKGVWIRDPDAVTKRRHPIGYDGFIIFNGIVIFVEVKVQWKPMRPIQKQFQQICKNNRIRHYELRYFPEDRRWLAIDPYGNARGVRTASELVLMLKEGTSWAGNQN